MELHRTRRPLVIGLVFIAGAALLLLCGAAGGSVRGWVLAGIPLVVGVALVASDLRPFRFHIGADGLTLRVAGLNRLVPWTEIDELVLDQPAPAVGGGSKPTSPFLMLVPATGSTIDQPLTGTSLLGGRAGLVLLDLDDVRQPTDEVAAALTRFGGDRFVDARRQRQERFASPEFAIGLRGYDPARVDELIRRAQDALASESALQRFGARAELNLARKGLPIALRGYNPSQVDSFLEELSAALARWPHEDEKPEAG